MAGLCSFGLYCWFLPALLVNVSAMDYGREDSLLTEVSRDAEMPSECVLSCTAQTYKQMLEKGDMLTVRFNPTSPSELGEHCWRTQIKHGLGEHLQHVYVMLPLHEGMQGIKDPPGLRPTFPFQQDILRPHSSQTTLSNDCGLRFEVTRPFITMATGGGSHPFWKNGAGLLSGEENGSFLSSIDRQTTHTSQVIVLTFFRTSGCPHLL